MRNNIVKVIGTWLMLPAVGPNALANEPKGSGFIDGGSAKVSFRYRFEGVEQDGFAESAWASTLKTRLTLVSGEVKDWTVTVEVDDVREAFVDDFNAGGGNTPLRTMYPGVVDPEGTEVNQAF